MSTFTPYNPDAQTGGDNDLEPPADGTYTVSLMDAGAFTAKSGKDFAKLQWHDPASGYKWTVLHGFKSEAQTAVTWSEIAKLGISVMEITELEQLNAELQPLLGGFFEVAVKTNGNFRNTYINGPAGQAPPSDIPSDIPASGPPQKGDPNDDGVPMPF